MPVPSLITQLDIVAGLNSPAGGEDVFPQLDNYLRAHAAFIAQTRQQIVANDLTKYQLACSDLTSELATNPEAAYFRTQRAFALNAVRASLIEESATGAVEIDILMNDVSIFSTPLTIDEGETTSTTAAVPYVLTTTEFPDDALVLIKIENPGAGARGLVVALQGADV
jgi:hypothetical protein